MSTKSLRTFGAAYAACALGFAVTAMATHVLGQKMLDSMVQVIGALVLP